MANMTPRAKRNRLTRIIERDGPSCQLCGRALRREEMTLDHVQAKHEGGGNNIENLRIACFDCNYLRHHSRPPGARRGR